MTSTERRRCMLLLKQAKKGELEAVEQLVQRLSGHFSYMIKPYRSPDPAYDSDDLQQHFQLGILQAIPKVDDRGDPLFHLAWRGQRAVSSLLATWKTRRQGQDGERSIGCIPEGFDIPDLDWENRPEQHLARELAKQDAKLRVRYILTHVSLTNRQWDVVSWMIVDEDTEMDGANLRLAHTMGVSPQMASKHRKAVMGILGGDTQPHQTFQCLQCNREFGSKGALTQHHNGQSGHMACTNIAQLTER